APRPKRSPSALRPVSSVLRRSSSIPSAFDPAVQVRPGPVALAVVLGAAAERAVPQRALHGLRNERVQRDTLRLSRALGLSLDLLDEAQRDAADVTAVDRWWRRGVTWCLPPWRLFGGSGDDHADVPAVEPHVDHLTRQCRRDLGGEVG